ATSDSTSARTASASSAPSAWRSPPTADVRGRMGQLVGGGACSAVTLGLRTVSRYRPAPRHRWPPSTGPPSPTRSDGRPPATADEYSTAGASITGKPEGRHSRKSDRAFRPSLPY